MPLKSALQKIERGEDLSVAEARLAFDHIFEGKIPAEQIGSFLLGLHKKGETVDELTGAVASMRSKMIAIKAPADAIDIVGTGGDGHGTLNISSAVALAVAACGVPVAKHGNRAASSRSGSSDILAALGLNLEPDLKVLERCLVEANLCFLFAPRHHPAMRHVAEIRKKLGTRTIFNLVGPLTNPANVKRHLIGVYELEWLGPMAEVLKQLGSEAAWLAHGQDGMDEITTTAPTDIVELRGGFVRHFALAPEDFGLRRANLENLKGGDAAHNAAELKKLLQGQPGPYRDIVLLNAGAALAVAGKYEDIAHGMAKAADAIDNGHAQRTLDLLVKLTNEAEPMTDMLEKICADKRAHVAHVAKGMPYAVVDRKAREASKPRGFIEALRAKIDQSKTALIAEIKKASPSAGVIRPDFSPAALAKAYETGGAACLSVLTDAPYFKGKNEDLIAARAACGLPVLRKDFMLDVWQVAEARAIGSDCILLIMTALDDEIAGALHKSAINYGMDVLIEVHDRKELDRALRLPSGLIGINNRNLKTLKTDLRVTEELAPLIPRDRIVVSESGLSTPADLARMHACGVNCFLIGESLLKQKDVARATKALLAG